MFQFQARTHQGHVRKNNEDSFFASSSLLVLADGMGGHAGGEVASRIATDMLSQTFNGSVESLYEGVELAQKEILQQGSALNLQGMGTTICVLALTNVGLMALWAGDSRIYLQNPAQDFFQVSEDDSYVATLQRIGMISPAQAAHHPMRHVITRSLGQSTLALTTIRLDTPGRFLLCSDGLSNELDNSRLAALLSASSLEAVADDLLKAVLATPARDNVTFIVADLAAL